MDVFQVQVGGLQLLHEVDEMRSVEVPEGVACNAKFYWRSSLRMIVGRQGIRRRKECGGGEQGASTQ